MSLQLYSYYRSSSAYRVRIALELLELNYEYIPVHLVNNGGEQNSPGHQRINAMKQVPSLKTDGQVINQSMAIIGYLDSLSDKMTLFPKNPLEKAKVMEACELINSGIQPIQNLAVTKQLEIRFSADQSAKADWSRHWISEGFFALEALLDKTSKTHCFGDSPCAADAFLIPQVYNADRYEVDMKPFTNISRVNKHCLTLEPFKKAHPDNQPDTPNVPG